MKASLTVLITLALTACGKSAPPPTMPAEQTFAGPMVQQLHDVQNQANQLPEQRKAELDRAIDQRDQ
jgi:hypothetical protein